MSAALRPLIAVGLVAALATLLIAAEAEKPEQPAKPASTPKQPRKHEPAPQPPVMTAESVVPLGKTVELNFKCTNDDLPKFTVVTATQSYGVSQSYDGKEDSNETSINGEVRLVDGQPNAVLITFRLSHSYTGREDSNDMIVAGSAVVPFGKEVKVLTTSDFSLLVTANELK